LLDKLLNMMHIRHDWSIFTRDRIRMKNVHIGDYTYGAPKILMWTDQYHVRIGKFCSFAEEVTIMVDGNHRSDWIITYPLFLIKGIPPVDGIPAGKGDIDIGNDVWIGTGALIMPGVKIGNGAVIGARSVVTKNVDDYQIVAGNPARHIRYRFTENQIKALKEIRWWDWDIEKIRENYSLLESQNVDAFMEKFSGDQSCLHPVHPPIVAR
jgi:acetyltransferase-like isoleucine patch superfamily enzyme